MSHQERRATWTKRIWNLQFLMLSLALIGIFAIVTGMIVFVSVGMEGARVPPLISMMMNAVILVPHLIGILMILNDRPASRRPQSQ